MPGLQITLLGSAPQRAHMTAMHYRLDPPARLISQLCLPSIGFLVVAFSALFQWCGVELFYFLLITYINCL